MSKLLTCPECKSAKVRINECSTFNTYTGEFVDSFKPHDEDTRASCGEYECDWVGIRSDLVEIEDE